MGTLLAILDFIVLLLLLVHIVRTVWMQPPQGTGSLVLAIFVALALIVFVYVSLTAYIGLVGESSLSTCVILFVILLIMLAIIRSFWASKPDRIS
jgi:hypothetical protein